MKRSVCLRVPGWMDRHLHDVQLQATPLLRSAPWPRHFKAQEVAAAAATVPWLSSRAARPPSADAGRWAPTEPERGGAPSTARAWGPPPRMARPAKSAPSKLTWTSARRTYGSKVLQPGVEGPSGTHARSRSTNFSGGRAVRGRSCGLMPSSPLRPASSPGPRSGALSARSATPPSAGAQSGAQMHR